jgi:16S rRNA (guanine527-N7)-methyltransferase
MPTARQWVDIGSGAGLPGIVVALVGPPGTEVHLIESNRRKCAFLRQAIRETGASATVHEGRAETILADWHSPVDCVTARAVAPLPRLIQLAAPLLLRDTPAVFPKGRGHGAEVAEAALAFDFDLVEHPSRIDPDGRILEIRNVRQRPSAGQS